jgi:hypothetical protein
VYSGAVQRTLVSIEVQLGELQWSGEEVLDIAKGSRLNRPSPTGQPDNHRETWSRLQHELLGMRLSFQHFPTPSHIHHVRIEYAGEAKSLWLS